MNKEDKFNEFWKLYPRKVAKISAQRSWKRLSNKTIDQIFDILHEHLARWKKTELQYIPHASTWLNQQRWEDELEPIDESENKTGVYKNIERERKKFLKRMKEAEKNMASDEERKKALGIKK